MLSRLARLLCIYVTLATSVRTFQGIWIGFIYNAYFVILSYVQMWGAARVSEKFDELREVIIMTPSIGTKNSPDQEKRSIQR